MDILEGLSYIQWYNPPFNLTSLCIVQIALILKNIKQIYNFRNIIILLLINFWENRISVKAQNIIWAKEKGPYKPLT